MTNRYIDPSSGLVVSREEFFALQGREDPFPVLANRDEESGESHALNTERRSGDKA